MMKGLVKWSRWILVAGMALGISATAVASSDEDKASEAQGRVPAPVEVPAKGTQCVQPTPEMRRNHMKYILHHRDETVHEGVRTKQYSLKECINCHVQPTADGSYPSIHSKDHFCNSCHSYAAVKIDCFQCHATHPPAQSDHAQQDHTQSSLQAMAKARMTGDRVQ